jgi:hypothetical protein
LKKYTFYHSKLTSIEAECKMLIISKIIQNFTFLCSNVHHRPEPKYISYRYDRCPEPKYVSYTITPNNPLPSMTTVMAVLMGNAINAVEDNYGSGGLVTVAVWWGQQDVLTPSPRSCATAVCKLICIPAS